MVDIASNTGNKQSPASERSLFRRFRLNAISYGYAQVVTLLAQLVLVPFFLKCWGAEHYADWLVLTGIPTILTLLDLGVAQASNSRASMLSGANDARGVCRSLQTALVFTLCVSAIILLLAVTVGQKLNWIDILGLSSFEQKQASTIMLIMSAYLCINLLGGPLDGWFKAIDHTAIGAFLLSNRRVVDILISIVVLVSGGSAVQLATAMLIGQVIILACLIMIVCRLSPWPVLDLTQASWAELRSIWRPAIAYAGFPLAQVITLQGGLQILNQVASPTMVVGFTMARTMMRLIIQLGVVSNNALKPEISRLAGRGEIDQARLFTLRATVWALILSSLAYLCAVIIGPELISWWGHGKVQIERGDLALIGFHTILNVAWFIPAALLIALNRHVSTAWLYGGSSVFSLLLCIGLAQLISPLIAVSILLALPELVVLLFTLRQINHKKF